MKDGETNKPLCVCVCANLLRVIDDRVMRETDRQL